MGSGFPVSKLTESNDPESFQREGWVDSFYFWKAFGDEFRITAGGDHARGFLPTYGSSDFQKDLSDHASVTVYSSREHGVCGGFTDRAGRFQ